MEFLEFPFGLGFDPLWGFLVCCWDGLFSSGRFLETTWSSFRRHTSDANHVIFEGPPFGCRRELRVFPLFFQKVLPGQVGKLLLCVWETLRLAGMRPQRPGKHLDFLLLRRGQRLDAGVFRNVSQRRITA